MFAITFIQSLHDTEHLSYGEIRLNQFHEHFESSVEFWKQHNYEAQWRAGIRRIVEDHKDSCLITSITDPAHANFLHWWPIYVDDTFAVFQNQMLFLDEIDVPFDIDRPHTHITPYQSVTEDGHKISEWRVPFVELKLWLSRVGQVGTPP